MTTEVEERQRYDLLKISKQSFIRKVHAMRIQCRVARFLLVSVGQELRVIAKGLWDAHTTMWELTTIVSMKLELEYWDVVIAPSSSNIIDYIFLLTFWELYSINYRIKYYINYFKK